MFVYLRCKTDDDIRLATTFIGNLWAEAESLAADFDGSLSGLGADLSTASYDMSEALLALPSLYHQHSRNGTSQQQQNSIA